MDVDIPLSLLGQLSPTQFMRRHWQKKPLLVRQAIPQFKALLSRKEVFALAAQEDVESRLIKKAGKRWHMRSGPLALRSLPPASQAGWTLLVQGVDLHHAGMHALLNQFRFVPDARLDDLMVSWASKGGGVGPHFDSYDVFLLQASGRRRWRIGRQADITLQAGVPLKILQRFEPEDEFYLDAGDMLYLPPGYAHDGVAVAACDPSGRPVDCMTYSIGFRAPRKSELAAQLLHRLAEISEDTGQDSGNNGLSTRPRNALYSDPAQPATASPAALPADLLAFARQAIADALKDPLALDYALGESLTEPKASVFFDAPAPANHDLQVMQAFQDCGIALDSKTKMMYGAHHIFINGESYRTKGADATLMRKLADQRGLREQQLAKASSSARDLLGDWLAAGWLHRLDDSDDTGG